MPCSALGQIRLVSRLMLRSRVSLMWKKELLNALFSCQRKAACITPCFAINLFGSDLRRNILLHHSTDHRILRSCNLKQTSRLCSRQVLGFKHVVKQGSGMEFCEVPTVECAAPDWLNKQFLERALRIGYKNPQLSVAHHDVTPATSPGDNYVSELYRIAIDLASNDPRLSVIIKCLPTAEYNLKFIQDARLFEKEINFYEETLPAMSLIDLAPRCLFTRNDLLILEDLTVLGFKMISRRCGLDILHSHAAMKSLARLHANSALLPNSANDLASQYPETVYHDYDHAFRYIEHSLLSLADVVETWPDYKHFGKIIRSLSKKVLDQVLKLMPRTAPSEDSKYFVLNHGDFWTNNIMFSYDSASNIKEVRVLDYQMCRYASLALDLQYFLFTSLNEESQTSAEQVLLDTYRQEFCSVMKQSDYFTASELAAEMKRTEIFGFLSACMMLPVVLANPEEKPPDLGNVAETSSTLEWHHGSQFRRQFQGILRHFEKKGLFD